MRKFSVLHLSDLHIRKYRNSFPSILKKLIQDVVKETKNIESLILIVTGDIIDKADYENSGDVAVSFFETLVKDLNNKITRIYFTPGNHDKKRICCDEPIQKYFKNKKYTDLHEKFENGDWRNFFSHPFDDYRALITKISERTKIEIITDLYYCDVFETNNCSIRVNCINSSLTSFNDYDYGELHIGKFQIEKIEKDFDRIMEDKTNKKTDISITIMHHPTFWLCKEEYDKIQYKISSFDSLSTDVLLRGHTHDRSLENYYSLYNSFSTLVTGVGSSESEADHPQRYSIYTFMCDLNLIEITMKASSEKGFIPDYSAYVSETDESRRKIHFPMHVHDFFSDIYLKLPLIKEDFQPIFPTKDVFTNMTKYSNKLLTLKEQLTNILYTYKKLFIDELKQNFELDEMYDLLSKIETFIFNYDSVDLDDDAHKFIRETLNNSQSKIVELVNGILCESCSSFAQIFFDNKLKDEEQIRVQFRVLNKNTRSHVGLTSYSLKGRDVVPECNITPVPWGHGLIKESYQKKEPLIYSLNKNFVTDRISETKWKDYITYSPDFSKNSYYHSKYRTNYPILTFGINSNATDSHLFFETLSLLPFKRVIDDFLLDIHNSFQFSFESLIRK